jgi:hypothetical protein
MRLASTVVATIAGRRNQRPVVHAQTPRCSAAPKCFAPNRAGPLGEKERFHELLPTRMIELLDRPTATYC